MRWYANLRVLLMAALLGAIVFGARSIWAAEESPGAAAAPAPAQAEPAQAPQKINPFRIVMENIDFVFVIIILCSIVGVALIIQGFITVRAGVMMPEESTNRIRELIVAKQFRELLDFTEADPSFVSRAMNSALKRAPSFLAMREAMETSVGEQTAEQFRKIEYLNIIGNLGPLLGLLGTVLGMINAFEQMKLGKGAASPAVLSGGISQALCHTMLGLLLALPCLAAFGVLRTMVDRLTVRGALLAEELLLMIRPTEARPAVAAAAAGVRPGVTPPLPAAAPAQMAPVSVPPAMPAQE